LRRIAIAALLLAATPCLAGMKVVDPRGCPVQNAAVTILLESKDDASAVFGDEPVVRKTDDRGLVPFDLPRVDGAFVVIDHQQFAPAVLALDGTQSAAPITRYEGTSLGGRLTGDGRAPFASGRICAIQSVANQTFAIRRCGRIADDGTFALSALPSGTVSLKVDVPAYLPSSNAILLPAQKWTGSLDAGLRAFVHVDDATGRPSAGASVECDGAVPATTDAGGNAWVAVSTSGVQCQALSSDGAESPSIDIHAPSGEVQTLRLRRVRIVTGKLVTDDATDPAPPRFTLLTPIGDVGQQATRAEPFASEAGTFRIRLPAEGPYALRVESPGMLPLTTDSFTLPAGGGTADLGVLILRRGAGIRGQVVRASTQMPLAGAVVSLEAEGRARLVLGRLGKASAVTDSDGSFTVAGVAIGSYRMRVAWRDLPPLDTAVDLREESVSSVGSIALHSGVRISGNVRRGDRSPLSAARVDLMPARIHDGEPVASAYTSADGRFGPIGVAPGTYRVLVRGDDLLVDQEIEVPADDDSFELDLDVRSTRLTGLIRDRGVPVEGGEVLLKRSTDLRGDLGVAVARNPRSGKQLWAGRSESSFSGTVDGAGVFSIDQVPAGRMVLEYFGRSGERVTRAIDVPDEKDASVEIEVGGWGLQGRVDDAEMETGLAANVELVGDDGTAVFRGTAQPSGVFTIERVAPGSYELVASAKGYRTSDPVRVVVGNEAPPPLRVRVTRAADATLDLLVKRGEGTLAAGVAVSVVDAVGRQLRASPTLADGKLHLAGLPPGTVHLIWSDPLAGVGISAAIQLRPGQQDMTVRLAPGKDLIVRCEASDCSGARLGSLAFTTEDGIDLAPFLFRMGGVVYSDRGAAYLGRLAPGSYDVAASSGAFRLNQRLELGTGPGEVDLFLKRR
jgi:hypothetical protein